MGHRWDGIAENEPKQSGTAGFPNGDILYLVDDPTTTSTTKVVGLLIGDSNRNGVTDPGEETIFYTVA